MVICSLDALKKSLKKKETRKGNSPAVTTSYLPQKVKEDRKLKDQNDEILGFDLVFVGQNNIDLDFIVWQFSKIRFSGILLNETLSCYLHSCMRHVNYSKNSLLYVEIQCFNENQGQLALCNNPLHKSYQQVNFAFSFQIRILRSL